MLPDMPELATFSVTTASSLSETTCKAVKGLQSKAERLCVPEGSSRVDRGADLQTDILTNVFSCISEGGVTVDLYGLVKSLKDQGLQTPCLFRFPDIVNHRMSQLQNCFDRAIVRYDYQVSFFHPFADYSPLYCLLCSQ